MTRLRVRDERLTPIGADKSIQDQVTSLFRKWHDKDPLCEFSAYLYNQVDESTAPYYAPSPGENEKKWEEALRKKPGPGSIPLLVRGPEALSRRLNQQAVAIRWLQNRMHEIRAQLENTRQKHELEYSVRAQEARRKHLALSRRFLAMGSKLQLLRNRGYNLDPAEEALQAKLEALEKQAFDPVVDGRQEEIWARMGVVRERALLLQGEFDKLAKERKGTDAPIDEDSMKTVEKVCHDEGMRMVTSR
jgi:nuclear pore complex protein Nup54